MRRFVFGVLPKHAVRGGDYLLPYCRDHVQYEIDLIDENADDQLINVEVKVAAFAGVGKDWSERPNKRC